MGFIAKDNGGADFKRVPAGVHIARCYSLIDLGTQYTPASGAYAESFAKKIKIGFELFGEDENAEPLTVEIDGKEMPLTISKNYTLSLGKKANLRRDLASWRGRDFSDEEVKAFDVSRLVGVYCMLNCTTTEREGKSYTNIASISPIPTALKASKPQPVHANVLFNLDEPNLEVFGTFYDKLQEVIKKSPEWQEKFGQTKTKPLPQNAMADLDDDLEIVF